MFESYNKKLENDYKGDKKWRNRMIFQILFSIYLTWVYINWWGPSGIVIPMILIPLFVWEYRKGIQRMKAGLPEIDERFTNILRKSAYLSYKIVIVFIITLLFYYKINSGTDHKIGPELEVNTALLLTLLFMIGTFLIGNFYYDRKGD